MRKISIWWLVAAAVIIAAGIVTVRARASREQEGSGLTLLRLSELAAGGEENAAEIVRLVETDDSGDLHLHAAAINLLGELGSPEALPYLRHKFAEGPSVISDSAAVAIGTIGTGEAAKFLIDSLDNENNAFFAYACHGLSYCAKDEAREALDKAEKEAATEERRLVAQRALEMRKAQLAENSASGSEMSGNRDEE